MLSDGRLKIPAGFGAGVYLFGVKISGDTMEITDEYGDRATGTR